MFLTSYDEPYILSETVMLAVLGVIALLAVLIAAVVIVRIVGAKKAGGAPEEAPAVMAVPLPASAPHEAPAQAGLVPAAGSLGEVDLIHVDDRTAALLMAIVADDIKAPLNTLRFVSIREVS
jgi:Na+-transporting methylmalonyl-CoA/oxaloacetate decarboxylase gamma subunit